MRRLVVTSVAGAALGAIAIGPVIAAASPIADHHKVTPYQQGMHSSANGALTAAGDLNGDGRADVLDTRTALTQPSTYRFGVTARDGRTGKVLWSKSYPSQYGGGDSAVPALLGKKGRPGVLLTVATISDVAGTSTASLILAGLSGKTGKPVWTRQLAGTKDDLTDAESQFPRFVGPIHDAKHKATDYLIAAETTVAGPSGSATPVIVSGVNGKARTVGSPVVAPVGEHYPTFTAMPDLDADGHGDIVASIQGTPGRLVAERGTNGQVIWQNATVDVGFLSQVLPVGRFSHKTTSDVAVNSNETTEPSTVVSGTNGHVVLTRTGRLYLLGTAGAKSKPAVGVWTAASGDTPTTVTETVTLRAVNVKNHAVYTEHATASVNKPAGFSGSGASPDFQVVGDVQPDASADGLVSIEVNASGSTKTNIENLRGLVDGRTGSYRAGPFEVASAGSLHKGAGADLLATTVHHGRVFVSAWNGVGHQHFYKRAVAGLHHVAGVDLAALRASGHNCSDLTIGAVNSSGSKNTLGVLTARAAPLWTVTFSGTAAVGGKLKHYSKPKHYCV